jgi:hypothetical protein
MAGQRTQCPADTSAVSSTFGYDVGGQDGTTLSTVFSVFF